MTSNIALKNQIVSFNSIIWNLLLRMVIVDSLMMWYYITCNVPGYACRISDGTVKKGNYIYALITTMKYSLRLVWF